MPGPLDGVTVVSLEQAVSAPIASRHLADLGARVIKIERVGTGDFARQYDSEVLGMSCHFTWLNRSKESIALDIRSAQGQAILESLIARADVVLQNMGTGAAGRAGLSPAQLVQRFPQLIACEISGYGRGGVYTDRPAYDLTIQAETGSIAVTGKPGDLAKPGVAIADIGAGMYAYSSILAALYERTHTGKGRAIDVAMFDVLTDWMGYSLNYTGYSGKEQVPFGIGTQAICPYGAWTTADGRQVVAGVQNEREWERLCTEVIDRPDLVEDPNLSSNAQRVDRREYVDEACADGFARLTFTEAQRRLDSARIANGLVRKVSEVWDHPQITQRDRTYAVPSPAGDLIGIKPVAVTDGWERIPGPIPAVGANSREILIELGFDEASTAELVAQQVIGAS